MWASALDLSEQIRSESESFAAEMRKMSACALLLRLMISVGKPAVSLGGRLCLVVKESCSHLAQGDARILYLIRKSLSKYSVMVLLFLLLTQSLQQQGKEMLLCVTTNWIFYILSFAALVLLPLNSLSVFIVFVNDLCLLICSSLVHPAGEWVK